MEYVFDRGLMSVGGKGEAEIVNAKVIVCRASLSELVAVDNLLVIARDIDVPLQTYLAEQRRLGKNVHGVVAPGFGKAREDMLSDIALCSGCEVVDAPCTFGFVRKVTLTEGHTRLHFDVDVRERLLLLDKLVAEAQGYDREKLMVRRNNFQFS